MTGKASPLLQALALSQAMMAAAREADWERLVRLESEREPLLMHPYGDDASVRQQLADLIATDRELMRLVAAARDAAAMQWKLESSRAQAIAAYGG